MRPSLFLGLLLIPAVALAIKDPPVDDEHWSKKYDGMFRKYSKHYFGPHVNWKWFKSQAIAESNLKPAARSPTSCRSSWPRCRRSWRASSRPET